MHNYVFSTVTSHKVLSINTQHKLNIEVIITAVQNNIRFFSGKEFWRTNWQYDVAKLYINSVWPRDSISHARQSLWPSLFRCYIVDCSHTVNCSGPRHYLNQRWSFVTLMLVNKLQRYLYKTAICFERRVWECRELNIDIFRYPLMFLNSYHV